MAADDFAHNEKSVTLSAATTVKIEHIATDGATTLLKDYFPLMAGEVLDATFMSKRALTGFLSEQIQASGDRGVLFSLHLKATMMKVSDPIIFGHGVSVFLKDVFAAHSSEFESLGVDPNNGIADLLAKIEDLPEEQRSAINDDIEAAYANGPGIAMVNSEKGITNLHVSSDVIIDASMPPMIRDSGGMWNADGDLQDVNAVIPDSSYAGIYDAVVRDVQQHGQLDPTANALGILIPIVRTDIDARGTAGGMTAGIQDDKTGLGDVTLIPLSLFWNFDCRR